VARGASEALRLQTHPNGPTEANEEKPITAGKQGTIHQPMVTALLETSRKPNPIRTFKNQRLAVTGQANIEAVRLRRLHGCNQVFEPRVSSCGSDESPSGHRHQLQQNQAESNDS